MCRLFTILTLILFSCAKEGKNIYIEGRVVNPVTGEGIEGVRLVLHKSVLDFGSGSSSKIKETAYSDANGNFVLKHNGSLVNEYIVLIEYPDGTEGYHLVGWKDEVGNFVGGYQLSVNVGKLMKVNLELVPYGNVRIWTRNINCFNNNDSLVVHRQNQYEYYSDGNYSRIGCIIHEPAGFFVRPMGNIYLTWTIYRDNATPITNLDTITIGHGDFTTFVIEY